MIISITSVKTINDMTTLEIRNVGPLLSAYVEFKKCTLFIGEQGAGKSTIAKLYSLFTWLEKGLLRHTISEDSVIKYNRFKNKYAAYHNLKSYFSEQSYILYTGEQYVFEYENEHLDIRRNDSNGELNSAKVMYVPAERNLLSVVESGKLQSGLSESMQTLMEELNNAKAYYAKGVDLPIGGMNFTYDRLNKVSWINGKNANGREFKIALKEASSGYQSLMPMTLVCHYLSDLVLNSGAETMDYKEQQRLQQEVDKIMEDNKISDTVKNAMLRNISARYRYTENVNVVEEMEQNLYPESQKRVLFDLLSINNRLERNKLVLTTHSPYLVNYVTLVVKAAMIEPQIPADAVELKDSLYGIVPAESIMNASDLAIYELRDGEARLLENYDGIPSDSNYLNQQMAETNYLFDQLLDIEEQIQEA